MPKIDRKPVRYTKDFNVTYKENPVLYLNNKLQKYREKKAERYSKEALKAIEDAKQQIYEDMEFPEENIHDDIIHPNRLSHYKSSLKRINPVQYMEKLNIPIEDTKFIEDVNYKPEQGLVIRDRETTGSRPYQAKRQKTIMSSEFVKRLNEFQDQFSKRPKYEGITFEDPQIGDSNVYLPSKKFRFSDFEEEVDTPLQISNEAYNDYDKFVDFNPEKSALYDIESVLNYSNLNNARKNRADNSVVYQPGVGSTRSAPSFSGRRASLGEFIVNDGDKLDPLISFLIKSHFCRIKPNS
jgi:hypothetical protein